MFGLYGLLREELLVLNARAVFKSLQLQTSSWKKKQSAPFSHFSSEELGYKLLAQPVSLLLLVIDRGQWKLPMGVPDWLILCEASVEFLAQVGMGDGWEQVWLRDIGW